MSLHRKENYELKRGTGYYAAQTWVGNSGFLTKGDFQDDLYEVGRRQTIDYRTGAKFNLCTHDIIVSDNGYLPASAAEFTSYRWYGEAVPFGDIISMRPGPSEAIAITPSPQTVSLSVDIAEVENARIDGYNQLIHLAPPRHMNALQAAMELKDTKSTLKPFLDFFEWSKRHLGRKVRVAKGLLRPLSAASKLADVASAYLWYKFGVEPTARDFAQLAKELSNGSLRVKGIKPKKYTRGQVIKAYYSASRPSTDILAAMYPNSPTGSVSIHTWMTRRWSGSRTWYGEMIPNGIPDPLSCRKVKVTGQVRGCFFAEVKKDFVVDGIDQLRDRWAWNCPTFRTMWELVPFSFLIDWVVDVGKYIERLEKRYVMCNYESKLGPIWGWEKTSSVVYAPSIKSLRMWWDTPTTLSSTEWGFKHNVEGSLSYYRKSSESRFSRGERSWGTGLAIPMLTGRIKAYQITTGMALLMQLAKSIKA